MVTVRGLPGYPWSDNTTPSDQGQYPKTVGNSGTNESTWSVKKVYNASIAFYPGFIAGTTSPNSTFGTNGTLIWTIGRVGGGHASFGALSCAKNAVDQTVNCRVVASSSGGTFTLFQVLYAPSTPAAQAYTNDGTKYIAGGGNPVTDWAGAPAHGGQQDSGVTRLTMTTAPTLPYIFVTDRWTSNYVSSNVTQDLYVWNFTTGAWDILTSFSGDLNASSTGFCAGSVTSADHINGSNHVYLRIRTGGTDATTSGIQAPVVYYGSANPVD
jgi:hypothetical protein